MAKSGERPAFLEEYYTSQRALDRESKRLAKLGYRVKSRRDTRDATGYRVTLVYVGETNQDAYVPIGAGKNDPS